MKRQLKLLIAVCLMGTSGFSQTCPTYTAFSSVLQGTTQVAAGSTISFPVTAKAGPAVLREKNKSAKLYLRLDLGEDYVKQNAAGWKFEVTVDVSYKFATPGAAPIVKTLVISDRAPEMLKVEDVLGSFATSSPAFGSTVNIVSITDGTTTLSGTGLLQHFIYNNLRLNVELAREYEVDVRLASTTKMSNAPLIFGATLVNRLVTFSWQPNATDKYPNYEVQVLKLFNDDPALQNDLNQITGTVDWSKALDIETQSCKTSVQLTMGEGTGYYIWRVRPVGNYYPGGIANSENYGEWSATGPSTATAISLNKIALTPTAASTPYAFYFKDPDEDINWIYNRVFTEGDTYDKNNPTGIKSSEGLTYADGLLRVRQNQKYNSSDNTNIVSQTISDYAGRPALTTVPVPSLGGLTGYKKGLVQDQSGHLYTAANFDMDVNLYGPDPVKDVATNAYSYYSANSSLSNNGVSNDNVPSAEGYPYKRTIFKTDGTNRVEEESGVGKTHAIGSQLSGKGRTTRVSYGTPSEDELIRIFGDEAPLSQSVIKTTTIDQNNVISISYTSKEGKTIATALSSPSVSNLSAAGTVTALTVNNVINQNVHSPGRVVASKRVAVSADNTTLNLAYNNNSTVSVNTDCINGECNYKLRIYLQDVKNNITYVSDANTGVAGYDFFTVATSLNFAANPWAFVDVSGVHPNLLPTGTGSNQLVVNAGEYIFIKELYSLNGPNYADDLVNSDQEKTRPIFDAIAKRMKEVDNPAKKAAFDTWLTGLRNMVADYNSGLPSAPLATISASLLSHLCIDPLLLEPGFLFPKSPLFNLPEAKASTTDPTMDNLEITMECCGTLSAQVPKSSLCVPCEGSPAAAYQAVTTATAMALTNAATATTALTPYGFDDFKAASDWNSLNDATKRLAIHDLVEREFIGALKEKLGEEAIPETDLWKIAPGFSFESLNFMISNMLISQYYTGNAVKNTTTNVWHEATKNALGSYDAGNVISASSPTYAYNYECKTLYKNWLAAMAPLASFEVEAASDNVLQAYDNSEGPGQALFDALNLDNFPPALQEVVDLLKGAIGDILNEYSSSDAGSVSKERTESLSCIPTMFMQLSGYQFAAIIDGSPLPAHTSSAGSQYPDEYDDFTPPSALTPTVIYTTVVTASATTNSVTNNYVPLLFTMNGSSVKINTTTCNSHTVYELYYPYTLKPEWMFKYFVYNVFENNGQSTGALNFIDDKDNLLPNQVQIELNQRYNPPFSYLTSALAGTYSATDLCPQPVTSSFTLGGSPSSFTYSHLNWTSKERYSFFDVAKGGGNCFTKKGITVNTGLYDNNATPSYPSKAELFQMANNELDNRINACPDKATEIKAALINELEAACYTIVPCKSSPPQTGEVTLKEIDLMVAAVINTMVAQLTAIQDNFTVNVTTNPVPCTNVASLTQTYSPTTSCDLPAVVKTGCQTIVLYKDNTLGLTGSINLEIKLFADCDQKILDMLEGGSFLPYIQPLEGCTNTNTKAWINCAENSCNTNSDYGEKTSCPSTTFDKFSKQYSVSATGDGN